MGRVTTEVATRYACWTPHLRKELCALLDSYFSGSMCSVMHSLQEVNQAVHATRT